MSEQPVSDWVTTNARVTSAAPLVGLVVRDPEEGYGPRAKPRLLDQVRAAIRTRHYSFHPERSTSHWPAHPELVEGFILFHGKRHPAEMGKAEISHFLTSLAVDRHVAASTQNQALAAVLFLYREVLDRDPGWFADVVRAKRPRRLIYTHVLNRGGRGVQSPADRLLTPFTRGR